MRLASDSHIRTLISEWPVGNRVVNNSDPKQRDIQTILEIKSFQLAQFIKDFVPANPSPKYVEWHV